MSPRRTRWLAWGILLIGLTTVAVGLAYSQQQSREQLNRIFQARADIARQFVASYISDTLHREQAVAAEQLAGPLVSDTQVRAIAESFGFSAVVVLDGHGNALDIVPAASARIGTNLASQYAHLNSAEEGVATVSHVVKSAALSRPVVAFAVPFDTAFGRRVFSGAFDVNATPVATYLKNALPQANATIYLVDTLSGVVVADKAGPAPNAAPLSAQSPQLAQAVAAEPDGSFTDASGRRYFVQRDVLNSPWRIVMSAPDATLYAPLSGLATWAPWAIFVALVLGTVAIGRLLGRLDAGRLALAAANEQLAIANADLMLLARVDKLTGVYNRRHIEEQLDIFLHAAARHRSQLAVLMLDVDHFKRINDNEGHGAGDRALQAIAAAIHVGLRPGDVFGRWGGEEFVVLLPGTDAAVASTIGERLRNAVADVPLVGDNGRRIHVTMSAGVAVSEDQDVAQTLMARADAALYRAKQGGRNRVAA